MKVAKRAPPTAWIFGAQSGRRHGVRRTAVLRASRAAPPMPSEDELREAFDGVDSDESGVIDGDEFKILCMQARATPLASNHRGAAARTRRCQR